MHKISLLCGGYTTVDAQDFADLDRYTWTNVNGYAARFEDGRTIYMHRQIMKSPDGIQVDHRDRDKLNNRRKNLRHATASQNGANRGSWGGSSFKGVSRVRNRWRADISVDGRVAYLGTYGTDREAAAAYNGAAKIVHGEFAHKNDVS